MSKRFLSLSKIYIWQLLLWGRSLETGRQIRGLGNLKFYSKKTKKEEPTKPDVRRKQIKVEIIIDLIKTKEKNQQNR